jgi:hypothetical protein
MKAFEVSKVKQPQVDLGTFKPQIIENIGI